MEIWEQQHGEIIEAFCAFRLYRDMGPHRKLREVVEAQGLDNGEVISWCRKWDWLKRCKAYDAYLDEVSYAEYQTEAKSMLIRHMELACHMLERANISIQEADLSSTQNLVRWIKEAVHIERQSRNELFSWLDKAHHQHEEDEQYQAPFTLLDLTDDELETLEKMAQRLADLKHASEGEGP